MTDKPSCSPETSPSLRKLLRHAVLVFLGYTAFYTVFFGPVVLGGRLLANNPDAHLFHYPAVFGGRSLWDPLLFSGYPRLADPQFMLWYPLALPLSLTGCEWLWNPFILSSFILTSCFTYGLVRRVTGSMLAAAAAGLVFGLSGFLLAHIMHVAISHGLAWLPLMLWALEELRRRWHRGWFAVFAIAVANCFLAGHVQIFVNSLTLCGFYVAWQIPGAPAGWWRYGLAAAAGVALGLGLSAVQLLPTAELTPHTQRARMSFADFASFSVPRHQLPQFVFPYIYGGATLTPESWLALDTSPYYADGVRYFGAWNPVEMMGYCGLLSLALAGVGVLGGLRSRFVWFFALVTVAGLILALGDSTPAAGWMYHLPVVNYFRCPCRFLSRFALGVAVLAGLGIHALQTLPRRRGVLTLALAGAVLLAGVGLAWYKVSQQLANPDLMRTLPAAARSPLPWENPALGLSLVGLLLSLPLLGIWYARRGRLGAAVLLVAVVIDLGLSAWFAGWRDSAFAAGTLRRIPEAVAAMRHDLRTNGERLLSLSPMIPSSRANLHFCKPAHLDAAPVNLCSCWDIPNALGYTPLAMKRSLELIQEAWPPLYQGKVDELFGIRYFLAPVRTRKSQGGEWDEIPLRTPGLGIGPGAVKEVSFEVSPVSASGIGLIAATGCAAHLPDGTAVAELIVQTSSGPLPPYTLRMGEHLAEFAWERADVRPLVRHRLPELTEPLPSQDPAGQSFQAHHTVAFFQLGERTTVTGVQLRWIGPYGPSTRPLSLTFLDDTTGKSHPVHYLAQVGGPWSVTGTLPDESHVLLRNRRPLQRAWLVGQVVQLPAKQIVEAIVRDRGLPDGTPFEPYRTALVEEAVSCTAGMLTPEDGAQITDYEPHRVRVTTHAAAEAFLVLGDVHYPGWEARIDGQPARIYRTDYVLRGVVVPAGEHVVEFVFRPWSLYYGLAGTGLAGLVLLTLVLEAAVADAESTRPSGSQRGGSRWDPDARVGDLGLLAFPSGSNQGVSSPAGSCSGRAWCWWCPGSSASPARCPSRRWSSSQSWSWSLLVHSAGQPWR